MEHISRQYVKSNTKESGLMIWLKPGAQRALKPALIHLGEVVSKNDVCFLVAIRYYSNDFVD